MDNEPGSIGYANEVAGNVSKIIKKNHSVFEKLQYNSELSVLMPGTGSFPGLLTLLRELINNDINNQLKKLTVHMIEPNLPDGGRSGVDSLINEIKTNIPSYIDVEIKFFEMTMQQFYFEEKIIYDVLYFEAPNISDGNILHSLSLEDASPRTAVGYALTLIKEQGLILVINWFEHETQVFYDIVILFVLIDFVIDDTLKKHAKINPFRCSLLRNACVCRCLGAVPASAGFAAIITHKLDDKMRLKQVDELIGQDRFKACLLMLEVILISLNMKFQFESLAILILTPVFHSLSSSVNGLTPLLRKGAVCAYSLYFLLNHVNLDDKAKSYNSYLLFINIMALIFLQQYPNVKSNFLSLLDWMTCKNTSRQPEEVLSLVEKGAPLHRQQMINKLNSIEFF